MFDPKRLKPDENDRMWAQTRDGRKVRVLCTDGPEENPIIGIVYEGDSSSYIARWRMSGRLSTPNAACDEYAHDLINLPEPPREIEVWAVVDRYGELRLAYYRKHVAELARLPDETLVRLTGTWEPND